MNEWVHTPVLVNEVIDALSPAFRDAAGGLFVDATLGEGGHSEALLARFPATAGIGVDADGAILAVAQRRLARFGERITFYHGWSQDFFAQYDEKKKRPDAILIDLGISLFHYEKAGRGFSFARDEALDMRIDDARGESAAALVAHLSEKDLADLLYADGEERYSRRIAHAIVQARKEAPITRSARLADIVFRAVPPPARHGRTHPATRTFQALRIAVNHELERLPPLLNAALAALPAGGRLAVITFHSLEDRIVKNYFRMMAKDCASPASMPICTERGYHNIRVITPKPICPSEAEITANSASRSAKLRVAEKAV
jgi:16S rRNA (cytosine1402-N4)-methyltransferase